MQVSDEQLKRIGMTPITRTTDPEVYKPPERTLMQEAGAGFRSGVDQLQAGLYGAASAVGNLLSRDTDSKGRPYDARKTEYLTDPVTHKPVVDPVTGGKEVNPELSLRDEVSNWLRRKGEAGYMRNMQEAEENAPSDTLDSAWEKGNLLRYAFGAIGGAIPSTLAMLGAGAATAATGGAAAGALAGMAGRGMLGAAAERIALGVGEQALVNAARNEVLKRGMASTALEAQTVARNIVGKLPDWAQKSAMLRRLTGTDNLALIAAKGQAGTCSAPVFVRRERRNAGRAVLRGNQE